MAIVSLEAARRADVGKGVAPLLQDIAHPEDAFDTDLIPHQRERHREHLLKTIDLLASMRARGE
jgi:hypothetical protein